MEENTFDLNEELLTENDTYFNIVSSIFKDESLSMENNKLLSNSQENEKENCIIKNKIKTYEEIIREKERKKRRNERYHLKSEDEKNILRKKNAICAKKCRLKKKEKEKALLEENKSLKYKIEILKKKISSLNSIISNYDFLNSKIYIEQFDSN